MYNILLKSYSVYSIIFLRVCLTIFSMLCMKSTILSINYHKRSNDLYITLKKTGLKKLWQVFQNLFYTSMVSLKVKQRIYDKNLEIQEVIDASMIEVCA